MPNPLRLAVVPLLLVVASWQPAQPTVLPRGPGAVLQAIQGFLGAAVEQDAARVQAWFLPKSRQGGADFAIDPKTHELAYQPMERATGYLHFADLGADGKAISCTEVTAVTEAVRTRIGGPERELEHRILSVHADCPSGDCSWGIVEFERSFRRDGQRVCQPMRATVLVQHQSEAPHMRIFHWHASPAGPEQLLKG